jgi:hypothetical protein
LLAARRAENIAPLLQRAFTLLSWLSVVSRVIVASAILNAALATARRPVPEGVFNA